MTDVMRMVYEDAEAMAQTFNQSTQAVQDTLQAVQSIANQMADGALLGKAGEAFVEVIRNELSSSLTKLAEKFTELEGDVKAAMQYFQEADSESAGKF